MKIFKNRLVLAILCIIVSGIIVWKIMQLAESSKETVVVIKTVDMVEPNVLITGKMLREVEVSKFKLPSNVITDKKSIVNKYSAVKIFPDDFLVPEKFKEQKALEDQFLYDILKNKKTAVSVSIKSLASGLSGKIMPGDIVSVLVYKKGDYQEDNQDGEIIEYPDLKYVEVGAINNSKAEDIDSIKGKEKKDTASSDTIIPATVTLIVDEQQAKTLALAENTGIIHLVFRGRGEEAKKLLLHNNPSQLMQTNQTSSQTPVIENSDKLSKNSDTQDKTSEGNTQTTKVENSNDFNIE